MGHPLIGQRVRIIGRHNNQPPRVLNQVGSVTKEGRPEKGEDFFYVALPGIPDDYVFARRDFELVDS